MTPKIDLLADHAAPRETSFDRREKHHDRPPVSDGPTRRSQVLA